MTKRTRDGEVLIKPPSIPEYSAPAQASAGETVPNPPRYEERPGTRGNPACEVATYKVEDRPAVDVAAEELLASSPFWSLLLQAGFTWWWQPCPITPNWA